MWIESFCGDLQDKTLSLRARHVTSSTHPIGQILGGKDTTKTLLIINDQHTIRSFRSTKLTRFRDGDILRHRQGWTGLESSNRAFGRRSLAASTASLILISRNGSFPRQLRFYLLANSLRRISTEFQRDEKRIGRPRHAWTAFSVSRRRRSPAKQRLKTLR